MSDVRELFAQLEGEGPSRSPEIVFDAATARARRIRRRRRVVAGGVVAVVVFAAAGGLWLSRRTEPRAQHVAAKNSAVTLEDFSSLVQQPSALAVSNGHLWVTGPAPGGGPATLLDFDTTTRQLVGTVQLTDDSPYAMAINSAGVWLRTQQGEQSTQLVKVDPATHRVVASMKLNRSAGLAVTEDAVWALDDDGLLRIDPATVTVQATVHLDPGHGFSPQFVSAGSLGVWLSNPYDNTILRVDEVSNTANVVASVPGAAGPILQGDGAVFTYQGSTLFGYDVRSAAFGSPIDVGSRIINAAVEQTSVWVLTAGSVEEVDLTTNTVSGTYHLSTGVPALVAVDQPSGGVWVATTRPAAVIPFRRAAPPPATSTPSSSSDTGPSCRADQLDIRLLGIQGTAGHLVASYWIANKGNDACQLQPYATVELLDASGSVLATIRASSTPGDSLPLSPNTDVNAGGAATPPPGIANINIWWVPLDAANGGGPCQQPTLDPASLRIHLGDAEISTDQVATAQYRMSLCGSDSAEAIGPSAVS